MRSLRRFAVVVALAAFAAVPAMAVQTVTPVQDAAGTTFAANGANSWAVTRGAGQTLVLFGRYSSDHVNESGLGLKVQYDETRFTNVVIDQVMNKCLVATPQIQQIAVANSRAVFAWADLSVRRTAGVPNGSVGWTGTADPATPSNSAARTDGCLDIATFGFAGPQTTGPIALPANLFRFTATLAAGFSSGSSPITFAATSASEAACTPAAGAPCFTDQTLVVTAGSAASPPVLQSVASRKAHGGAGTFDLPLTGAVSAPTVEPRNSAVPHLIVFKFDRPVTAGNASVTEGVATAGAPTFNGNEMRVPLTGVNNQQYVTVTVSSVSAADGGTGGAGSIRIGYLLGDVNQNRVVSLSDLGLVNAQVAQFVTAANYLKDVNISNTMSLADKGIVNGQVTKGLPAP